MEQDLLTSLSLEEYENVVKTADQTYTVEEIRVARAPLRLRERMRRTNDRTFADIKGDLWTSLYKRVPRWRPEDWELFRARFEETCTTLISLGAYNREDYEKILPLTRAIFDHPLNSQLFPMVMENICEIKIALLIYPFVEYIYDTMRKLNLPITKTEIERNPARYEKVLDSMMEMAIQTQKIDKNYMPRYANKYVIIPIDLLNPPEVMSLQMAEVMVISANMSSDPRFKEDIDLDLFSEYPIADKGQYADVSIPFPGMGELLFDRYYRADPSNRGTQYVVLLDEYCEANFGDRRWRQDPIIPDTPDGPIDLNSWWRRCAHYEEEMSAQRLGTQNSIEMRTKILYSLVVFLTYPMSQLVGKIK